jgi:molybdate transport system substrate-binding protein
LGHRVTASVVALLLVAVAAACGDDHKGGAGQSPTTAASTTAPAVTATGAQPTVNSTTISIFAASDLGQVLQQLTAAYKDAHPESAFQITTGNTDELVKQIQQGARPNFYIDDKQRVGRLSKTLVHGEVTTFGNDTVVAVTPVGNPKHITDLRAFGASPGTTSGMCDAQITCGQYGRQLLQAAKIVPIPDVVDMSQSSLVDRVAGGQLDTALVMRSASRSRFAKLGGIPLYYGPNVQIDYQVVPITPTPNSTEFIRFATELPGGKRILAMRGYLPLAVLKGK